MIRARFSIDVFYREFQFHLTCFLYTYTSLVCSTIAPLGIRISENLSSIGFSHKNSTFCTVPSVPPWLLRRPCFNYDMYAFDKNSVSAEVLRNHFAVTKNGFGKHVEIDTDGSKTGGDLWKSD